MTPLVAFLIFVNLCVIAVNIAYLIQLHRRGMWP